VVPSAAVLARSYLRHRTRHPTAPPPPLLPALHPRPLSFTLLHLSSSTHRLHTLLQNDRSVSVVAPKSGNGVTLVTRDPKASRFAAASAYKRNTVRGNGRKVAGAVAKAVGSDAGRLDLRSAVQARASAILASQSSRKAQRVRAARGNQA